MAFRERIELVVDVVTGQSRGSLRQLSTDIKDADGAFGKMKAGASGAFDFLKANAGVAALAVGSALTAMGAKSIAAFEDATLGAGKLRDALGITAEEASRLQEVAGDLGIGVEAVESTLGKMNVTAGKTPEKFDAIGAAIVKNRDGTVNVMQTFLSVVDALDKIPSATQRAAAAQQVFGRGWQSIAELVMSGADGVREALAGVEKQKVFNDKQIAQGRELRDDLDELKGVAESAALVIGGKLAQAIITMIDAGKGIAQFIQEIEEDIPKGAKEAGFSFGALGSTLVDIKNQVEKNIDVVLEWARAVRGIDDGVHGTIQFSESVVQLGRFLGQVNLRINDTNHLLQLNPWDIFKNGAERAAEAADDLAKANEQLAEDAENARKFIDAVTKAFLEQVDAAENAADGAIDVAEAQQKFAEAAAVTNGLLGKHGQLLDDSAEGTKEYSDAVNDERDALVDAAKAGRDLAVQQAAASGQTLTATQKVDAFNKSLEDNAAYATPAAKRAAYEYLIQLNQIPPEKAAEILTLVDQGRLSEANAQVNNASRTRTAAIVADAETAAAERALNAVARLRTAQIQAQLTGARTSGVQLARGGVAPPGGATAGEAGAELIEIGGKRAVIDQATLVPGGTVVTPLESGAGAAVTGGAGAGGGGTMNITINMPPGSNGNDVVRAIRDYERRNGKGWRAS